MPCPREISAGLYRLLRAKMILGFGLGLRSAEATRLPVSALSGPEPVLRVRRGKTPYADRNLYLRYLLLPAHLDELLAFGDARRRAVADPDAEPLLATSAHPRGYDSSYLASLCSRLLQPAVGEAVCFHHLRHAFASWFLVCALVAVGVVPLPTDLPFASSPAFTSEALERLRILLFGFGPPWEGRATVSHAVVALAFLLGHSNPETTLTTYWHSAEIILALLQGRCDEQPSTGV
jgi:integrase